MKTKRIGRHLAGIVLLVFSCCAALAGAAAPGEAVLENELLRVVATPGQAGVAVYVRSDVASKRMELAILGKGAGHSEAISEARIVEGESGRILRVTAGSTSADFSLGLEGLVNINPRENAASVEVRTGAHTWTWDEYLAAAERLTNSAAGQWGVSTYPWDQAIRQNGGEIVDPTGTTSWLDRPEAIDAIQWVADLALVHQVRPRPGTPPPWGTDDPFSSGKVAFHATGDWDLARYMLVKSFPWQVTSLPHKVKRVQTGAPSYQAFPKAGKEPDVAWEFGKYFTLSREAQRIMSDAGKLGVPPYKPLFDQLFLAEPYLAVKKNIAEAATYNVTTPTYPDAAEVDKLTNSGLAPVWSGKQKAKEAMAALVPSLNAALKHG